MKRLLCPYLWNNGTCILGKFITVIIINCRRHNLIILLCQMNELGQQYNSNSNIMYQPAIQLTCQGYVEYVHELYTQWKESRPPPPTLTLPCRRQWFVGGNRKHTRIRANNNNIERIYLLSIKLIPSCVSCDVWVEGKGKLVERDLQHD